jgi:hypothetical protein
MRKGSRAFFVHGFAKNEVDNISDRDLRGFKMLAADLLNQPASIITAMLKAGTLAEVL